MHSCRRTVVVLFNQQLGDKKVHIFPKDICTKVNVIAWLEFKFDYNDVAVQHI